MGLGEGVDVNGTGKAQEARDPSLLPSLVVLIDGSLGLSFPASSIKIPQQKTTVITIFVFITIPPENIVVIIEYHPFLAFL